MSRTKPYNVAEFAAIAGRSVDTIYRWIRDGYITAERAKKYNQYLIPSSELRKVAVELDDFDTSVIESPDQGGRKPADIPRIQMSDEKLKEHHDKLIDVTSKVLKHINSMIRPQSQAPDYNQNPVLSYKPDHLSYVIDSGKPPYQSLLGYPDCTNELYYEHFLQHMAGDPELGVIYQQWLTNAEKLQTQLDSLLDSVTNLVDEKLSSLQATGEKILTDGTGLDDSTAIRFMRGNFIFSIYDCVVYDRDTKRHPSESLKRTPYTVEAKGNDKELYFLGIFLGKFHPYQMAYEVREAHKNLVNRSTWSQLDEIKQIEQDLLQIYPNLKRQSEITIDRGVVGGVCEVCGGFQKSNKEPVGGQVSEEHQNKNHDKRVFDESDAIMSGEQFVFFINTLTPANAFEYSSLGNLQRYINSLSAEWNTYKNIGLSLSLDYLLHVVFGVFVPRTPLVMS